MKGIGIVIFLLLTANIYCQSATQTKVDSLNNLLANTEIHDTTKANLYFELSELLYVSNLDTILPLCSRAVDISEKNLKTNISTAEKNSYLTTLSSSQNSIGVYYYYHGNKKLAIEFFEKSLKAKKQTNDLSGLAEVLNNLGFIQSSYGELNEALDYYLLSLEIRKKINDKREIAVILNNIGAIHYKTGNYASAFEYYSESLNLGLELDDVYLLAMSYNNLGNTYIKQGILTMALKYFDLAKIKFSLINDKRNIIATYNNIGYAYIEKKEYKKALSVFLPTLKMSENASSSNFKAEILNNISVCYKNLDEIDSAKHYNYRSLVLAKQIGDKISQSRSYANIGSFLLSEQKYKSADSLFEISLNISSEVKSADETKKTLRIIYRSQIEQNNIDNAKKVIYRLIKLRITDLEQNFVVLSEREKELYFNTISSDFQLFYEFADNNKENLPDVTELAYNNSLRNKGLLLKSTQAMKSVILNSENSSLIVTYNEWIDLKKSISVLYAKGKNTEGKEAEANKIEKELISASSDFKNFNNAQKITWKEIQNELKPRDIAIEFIQYNELLGNERIYSALIVTANRKYPLMVKICSERDIQSIIGTIQGNDLSYINKIYGKDYKAFQELYNVIWKPLEPHLNNVNNIYLSPTGLLHKISFSALKNPNNIYLCDQYKIHLMGSTGKLTEKNNTENISNYSIKLFGGVNFNKKEGDREVWSYLPGTLNEVESIYAKLKKKKIDVELFTDENASEKKFKTVASDCNILHIATHGFFYPDPDKIDKTFSVKDQSEQGDLAFRGGSDQYGMWSFVQNKNPLMRSGVVLSGANDVWLNTKQDSKNDGVLTAQEVATIDMRKTDLVVLSACETGLGDIKGSEGVYGLQRSFKMAGVKYIIMSLWQVPDKETSEFMSLFYKSVLKTNDIEQSFRITQLKMRKKYAPYYWAAFVLIE